MFVIFGFVVSLIQIFSLQQDQYDMDHGDQLLLQGVQNRDLSLIRKGIHYTGNPNVIFDSKLATILGLHRENIDYLSIPALHYSISDGENPGIASFLLNQGADPKFFLVSNSLKTNHSNIPKHVFSHQYSFPPAILYGFGFGNEPTNRHAAFLQRLYESHPTILNKTIIKQWRDITGSPPMTHIALLNDYFDGLYLLIDLFQTDINETDEYGLTPLHLACWFNDLYSISYLLHRGADLLAQDYAGRTALHYASMRGNTDVIHLLFSNPSKLSSAKIDPIHKKLLQMKDSIGSSFDSSTQDRTEINNININNNNNIILMNSQKKKGMTALQYASLPPSINPSTIRAIRHQMSRLKISTQERWTRPPRQLERNNNYHNKNNHNNNNNNLDNLNNNNNNNNDDDDDGGDEITSKNKHSNQNDRDLKSNNENENNNKDFRNIRHLLSGIEDPHVDVLGFTRGGWQFRLSDVKELIENDLHPKQQSSSSSASSSSSSTSSSLSSLPTIDIVPSSELSINEFVEKYFSSQRPVLISQSTTSPSSSSSSRSSSSASASSSSSTSSISISSSTNHSPLSILPHPHPFQSSVLWAYWHKKDFLSLFSPTTPAFTSTPSSSSSSSTSSSSSHLPITLSHHLDIIHGREGRNTGWGWSGSGNGGINAAEEFEFHLLNLLSLEDLIEFDQQQHQHQTSSSYDIQTHSRFVMSLNLSDMSTTIIRELDEEEINQQEIEEEKEVSENEEDEDVLYFDLNHLFGNKFSSLKNNNNNQKKNDNKNKDKDTGKNQMDELFLQTQSTSYLLHEYLSYYMNTAATCPISTSLSTTSSSSSSSSSSHSSSSPSSSSSLQTHENNNDHHNTFETCPINSKSLIHENEMNFQEKETPSSSSPSTSSPSTSSPSTSSHDLNSIFDGLSFPYLGYVSNLSAYFPDILPNEFQRPDYFNLCSPYPGKRGEKEEEPYQLFIGPRGAGTPLHSHNATWNVLLFGIKRWYLINPGQAINNNVTHPPTHMSTDSPTTTTTTTTSSSSSFSLNDIELIREEILKFFPLTPQEWIHDRLPLLSKQGIVSEVTQYPGEVLFIPHNWLHMTLSLTDTASISQEFCTLSHSSQHMTPLGSIIYGSGHSTLTNLKKTQQQESNKQSVYASSSSSSSISSSSFYHSYHSYRVYQRKKNRRKNLIQQKFEEREESLKFKDTKMCVLRERE